MRKHLSLKFLIALVLLTALAALPAYAQNGRGRGLEVAIAAQEFHTDVLMANPGVVGTGVGLNADGEPVVVILTETRGVRGLPRTLDGVSVVVRQAGRIYALHHRSWHGGGEEDTGGTTPAEPARNERWLRPVPPGVSTGHPDITAGTIGARVIDETGNVYALSNNHVYANENQASTGDAVIQPGAYDNGSSPGDDIGTLYDFELIQFPASNCNASLGTSDPDCNVIDAAIASTTTALLDNSTPSDGYGTPKSTTAQAYPNQKVKKYGRTTGLTKGSVYVINATVDVGYSGGVARFVNQIVIQPGGFSAGGDSGSLIVVDGKGRDKAHNNEPVGLLYAGSSFFTIANPIDAVLTRFGVDIDGE